MPKNNRSRFWFSLLLGSFLLFISSCGEATKGASTPTKQAQSDSLYVLTGYNSTVASQQNIIAFQAASPQQSAGLSLPAGLISLDHQYIYNAEVSHNQTTIKVLATRDGALLRSFIIPGSYSTSDRGVANSMLSGDGRWLALRATAIQNATTIVLLDTQLGKLVKTIHLSGVFTLDGISPTGSMLYLLNYESKDSGHYSVRAYDTQTNALLDGLIVDKQELNETKMEGIALTRQLATNGSRAYTLYTNSQRNLAFIHILPLADNAANGQFARCLDLPVGLNANLLRYYTLTLSTDGKTLYAANAALGIIAKIDVSPDPVYNINPAKIEHFNPGRLLLSNNDQTRQLYNGAALSPDQQRLYVVGPRGIWVFHTMTLQVQGQYVKDQSFTGIASSPTRQLLYAVNPAIGIMQIDSASGQQQRMLMGSTQAPWGIAWLTS